MKATVRVMRSYDYCHFEVVLSSDEEMDMDQVNELRKKAALLVDEGVRQYIIAKKKENDRNRRDWEIRESLKRLEIAKQKSESELTIEETALLRADADKSFWENVHKDDYYYEDEEREHHFSMLSQFQNTVVKCIPGPDAPDYDPFREE